MSFIQTLIDSANHAEHRKVLQKGEFLIREGEIEKNFYFIETGAVRIFLLSEYEEHTIRFGYEQSMITSLSLLLSHKSLLNFI